MAVGCKFEQLLPDITKAAKSLSRQYISLEYEDIYQDLCEYAWANRERIKTFGAEGGNPLMILSREGKRLCGKQIASRAVRDDRHFYAPKEVRFLLENDALVSRDGDIEGRSDLVTAFRELSEEDREIIGNAYLSRLAEYKQPGAASKALSRSIDRLAIEMNRIGENKSRWHHERLAWVGSKSLVDTLIPAY